MMRKLGAGRPSNAVSEVEDAEPEVDGAGLVEEDASPRERGLAAAVQLVLEHGTADIVPLTLHELCERVGLSTAIFYRSFDSIGAFHKAVVLKMLWARSEEVWQIPTDDWISDTLGSYPDVSYAAAGWLEGLVGPEYLEPWAWGDQPEIRQGVSDFRNETTRRGAALVSYILQSFGQELLMPPDAVPAIVTFSNDASIMTRGLAPTVTWTDVDNVERESTIFTVVFRCVIEAIRVARYAEDDQSQKWQGVKRRTARPASDYSNGNSPAAAGSATAGSVVDGPAADGPVADGSVVDGPAVTPGDRSLSDFVDEAAQEHEPELVGGKPNHALSADDKQTETQELREQFFQAVITPEFSDPLQNLTFYKVATAASMSPSTLSYQFADAADMRLQTFGELLARVQTSPNENIIHSLEAAVLEGETTDQIIARYMRACARQLAEDPMYPYLVGAAARRSNPEVEARYTQVIADLGRGFAVPLRIALASSGMNMTKISRGLVEQLVAFALLSGASARFLAKDRHQFLFRGTMFEVGGASLAATLKMLLDADSGTIVANPAKYVAPARSVEEVPDADSDTAGAKDSKLGGKRVRNQRQAEHDYPRRVGLVAAADLALSLGPADIIPLSVAEVCAAAGTGTSAFYRAFKSADSFREAATAALLQDRLNGPEKLRTYTWKQDTFKNREWVPFTHHLADVTHRGLDRDSHMQTWAWARSPYVADAIARHVDDVVSLTVDPQLEQFLQQGRVSRMKPEDIVKSCRQVNDAWVVTRSVLELLTWTDIDGVERTTSVHSLGLRAMMEALLTRQEPGQPTGSGSSNKSGSSNG